MTTSWQSGLPTNEIGYGPTSMGSTDFVVDPDNDDRDLAFRPPDPSAATTLTPAQVEHYNEHGFVAPVVIFDAAGAVAVRDYVDGLLESVLSAPDARNAYSINAYHLVCEGLYDLLLTPRILDLVQDILGPDFVCWGDHLFCKLPGDPMEVPLHQDAVYWPFTPTKSVTVWLAIDDADEENAAMQFVPGSHRIGPLPHEEKPLDGTRVLKRQVRDPDRYGERYVNALRAGEASLHSDLLLHGSDANRSDRRRAGLTLRYVAADVRVVPGFEFWAMPAVHCRGTIPEHWPHWPRPTGEHPELFTDLWGDFDGIAPPDAG
jgi:non-heme Fe2+,alpha-ketoglutarate-dependent halogenase